MRLLIIRHGESQADLLGVHEGRANYELTERGCQQANAMACFVAEKYDVSAIYCSPLKRAYQTGTYLSEKTGVPLSVNKKLMEFDNGLIAGLKRSVAQEQYPIVQSLPIHASVYEQESLLDFRYRADYVLSQIISATQEDATVAIITHGGMINQLYRSFLRLPVDSDLWFPTGDAGVHEWQITSKKKIVVYANHTAHTNGI